MVLAEDHHAFLVQMMSRGDYPNYSRSTQAAEFGEIIGSDEELSLEDGFEEAVEYFDEEVGVELFSFI